MNTFKACLLCLTGCFSLSVVGYVAVACMAVSRKLYGPVYLEAELTSWIIGMISGLITWFGLSSGVDKL